MNFMRQRKIRSILQFILIVGLMIGISGGIWQPVRAQTNLDGWSTPVNLSNSGQTTVSLITADSSGMLHAFWLDGLSGMQYSHSTSEGWSDPVRAEFPIPNTKMSGVDVMTTFMPSLVSGPENWVYLFWQDANVLHFAVTNTSKSHTLATWSGTGLLARSSVSYKAYVDEDSVIHLAYIQPVDLSSLSAGVYYMRSLDHGASWSVPVLLYRSPYYRSLLQPEYSRTFPVNSVDLAVSKSGDQKIIYAAFDNQPRSRVFVVQSTDGGQKWGEASEVDGPSAGSGISVPGDIHVSALNQNAVLIWQVKQSDTVCFTYSKSSSDSGAHWGDSQRLNTPYPGCAEKMAFLPGMASYSLLFTSASGLPYLAAWNGEEWSGFNPQSSLASFTDPETFNSVAFEVKGVALKDTSQLVVVGKDNGASQDTWFTARALGDIASWFVDQPGWKAPQTLQTLTSDISDLQILNENKGRLHAFWIQKENLESEPGALVQPIATRVVYYSYLENNQWSVPILIQRGKQRQATAGAAQAAQDISRLAVAKSQDDRLWIVWQNSPSGETYYSWANASSASAASEWSGSQWITKIPLDAGGYSVVIDRSGVINIFYSIMVNEGRGIYLIQSRDQGKTWSDPSQIFDGTVAGWKGVSKPSAAVSTDGSLYLLFGQQSPEDNQTVIGLSATFSKDHGASWSPVETVTTQSATWYRVLAHSSTQLHRIWLEENGNNQLLLLHQDSNDGGATWGRVERVAAIEGTVGKAEAAMDDAGRVHLIDYINDSQTKQLMIEYRVWNGGSWSFVDSRNLGAGALDDSTFLSTGVTPDGVLGLVLSRSTLGSDPYHLNKAIYAFYRRMDVPKVTMTPLPPLPTETATTQVQLTATQKPTPTIDLTVIQSSQPSRGGSTIGGLLIGLVASVLVIGGGVGYAFYQSHRRKED